MVGQFLSVFILENVQTNGVMFLKEISDFTSLHFTSLLKRMLNQEIHQFLVLKPARPHVVTLPAKDV